MADFIFRVAERRYSARLWCAITEMQQTQVKRFCARLTALQAEEADAQSAETCILRAALDTLLPDPSRGLTIRDPLLGEWTLYPPQPVPTRLALEHAGHIINLARECWEHGKNRIPETMRTSDRATMLMVCWLAENPQPEPLREKLYRLRRSLSVRALTRRFAPALYHRLYAPRVTVHMVIHMGRVSDDATDNTAFPAGRDSDSGKGRTLH